MSLLSFSESLNRLGPLGDELRSLRVFGFITDDGKLHTQEGCANKSKPDTLHVLENFRDEDLCATCTGFFLTEDAFPLERRYVRHVQQMSLCYVDIKEKILNREQKWMAYLRITQCIDADFRRQHLPAAVNRLRDSVLKDLDRNLESWAEFLGTEAVTDILDAYALRKLCPNPKLENGVLLDGANMKRVMAERRRLKKPDRWGLAVMPVRLVGHSKALRVRYPSVSLSSRLIHAPDYLLRGMLPPQEKVIIVGDRLDLSVLEVVEGLYDYAGPFDSLESILETARAI